jgi:hypothetical protein
MALVSLGRFPRNPSLVTHTGALLHSGPQRITSISAVRKFLLVAARPSEPPLSCHQTRLSPPNRLTRREYSVTASQMATLCSTSTYPVNFPRSEPPHTAAEKMRGEVHGETFRRLSPVRFTRGRPQTAAICGRQFESRPEIPEIQRLAGGGRGTHFQHSLGVTAEASL